VARAQISFSRRPSDTDGRDLMERETVAEGQLQPELHVRGKTMKTFVSVNLALGAIGLAVYTALAQPPAGEIRTRQAPPPGRYGGRPGGPPPRWELGKLMPPHIQDELNLTEEQQKQLQDLEKEVRDRVMKMLTSEQKDKLKKLERRGPGEPPDRRGESPDRRGPPRREGPPDRGGPPDREGPPDRPGRPEPPDDRRQPE
jgi:hypothetical protein